MADNKHAAAAAEIFGNLRTRDGRAPEDTHPEEDEEGDT